jgi:RNA polymerase sigma factor (sigma-70 family)
MHMLELGSDRTVMNMQTQLVDDSAELFQRFQDGDRNAMEPLVRLLNPVLWNVARGCGLTVGDAEDVVQTAWLRLVDKTVTIRDPRTVIAWLGTTVRREAWHVSRKTRPASPLLNDFDGPASTPGPDQIVLLDEESRLLWDHFSRLSPKCQAILRVICLGGQPDYAALSEALGIPVGSIGPTRGRCLTTLRRFLTTDPAWSTL